MAWWSKAANGKWETCEVGGHEVRYWLPTKRTGPFALLFLHDVDSKPLEDVPGARQLMEKLNWPIICPQASESWWLDRIVTDFDATVSPMHWLLEQVVPWAMQRFTIPPRGLALLGIGMGGQGVLQLAFTQGERFPVVVSLQAAIAFDQLYGQGTCLDQCYTSPEHARQYTAGMLVNPHQTSKSLSLIAHPNDPLWYRGNDRLREKLVAVGVPAIVGVPPLGGAGAGSTLTVEPAKAGTPTGGTPTWWEEQLGFASKYIQAAMQAESRRLL